MMVMDNAYALQHGVETVVALWDFPCTWAALAVAVDLEFPKSVLLSLSQGGVLTFVEKERPGRLAPVFWVLGSWARLKSLTSYLLDFDDSEV